MHLRQLQLANIKNSNITKIGQLITNSNYNKMDLTIILLYSF